MQFREISKSNFVYSYKIQNKQNFYHLFFITKNILGAEKFLAAKNKVKQKLENQLDLFDIEDKEQKIKDYLKDFKSNIEIYQWCIEKGILPSEINKSILAKLEKENVLEIKSPHKRTKGSFYINHDNYKNETYKLSIKIKNE